MTKKNTSPNTDKIRENYAEKPAEDFAAKLLMSKGFKGDEFISAFKKGRESFSAKKQLAASGG